MWNKIVLMLLGLCLSMADSYAYKTSCQEKDFVGNWTFHLSEYQDEYHHCNSIIHYPNTIQLELKESNVVVDMDGNEGFWTIINGWGFEVVIHGRKYYSLSLPDVIIGLDCDVSLGSTHDVLGRGWSCYDAAKNVKPKGLRSTYKMETRQDEDDNEMYKIDEELIEKINSDPNILWYAKKYEQFEKLTVGQMKNLIGTKSSWSVAKPVKASEELKESASQLPEHFDWRNVDGVNYINKARNQSHNGKRCGGCYAFASTGMNEARLNIATRGKINVTLSPQDVIECNSYTTGCSGGFAFSTGGKFAEDFGMVEESCNPYKAINRKCNFENRNQCKKYYFTNYQYIGGHYGNCNEESMLLALFKHGPITVDILSDKILASYKGGVFYDIDVPHNSVPAPIVKVNHAVLIVGYGVEQSTNTKYWIAKNSYGDNWGENGFFRIRRGTNERGIESAAFQSFPIF